MSATIPLDESNGELHTISQCSDVEQPVVPEAVAANFYPNVVDTHASKIVPSNPFLDNGLESWAKQRSHTLSESSLDNVRRSADLTSITKKNKKKNQKRKSCDSCSIVSDLSNRTERADKRWNVFRSIPRDQDVFEPKWTILASQVLKVVVYIVLHVLVAGSAVVSKMFVLLFATNLVPNLPYTPCKRYGKDQSYVPQDQERLPNGAVAWFYWGLFIAMAVPELLTFLRCLRHVCFRFVPSPTLTSFLLVFVIETLQCIGVCLLIFVCLPQCDSVRGAMITCSVAITPTALSFLTQFGTNHPRRFMFAMADLFALVAHSTGLWLWPMLDKSTDFPRLVPLSLFLTSLGWWENFVTKNSTVRFITVLGSIKEQLHKSRYKSYVVLAPWRIALTLFIMLMSAGTQHDVELLFNLANPMLNFNATTTKVDVQEKAMYARSVFIMLVWLVLSAWLCYNCGKYACKIRMDRFAFAIPVVTAVPLTVVVLISLCESKHSQPCYFASRLPDKVFWNCNYANIHDLLITRIGWSFVVWYLAYFWIVSHVFTQKPGRLSSTDMLFVLPMYSGVLVDQSLALNRRRQNNINYVRTEDLVDDGSNLNDSAVSQASDISLAVSMTSLSLSNSSADTITKIYICATMWHETPNEMTQMLKSIMRMDEDQSARKNAQKYLKVVDRDYYELETHIFFDDAWEFDEAINAYVPNSYVRQFMSVIDEAASAVHHVNIKVAMPIKFVAPYGARLVWTLPGDTRLFVHMKDKRKIRHKKRWSQVMYMYYLLGHRIMELIQDVVRKQLLADNTFLLTIDGDSKFSPSSVQKLVDLMKKNRKLGSACGRIHPIGSGVMVWYQKFEYAIAHWFQKAAEHVFGCVLCSPGCFSLFRGSALMDDNVMNKYTKVANDPRHFVQYDQGEDRWLSTLLLKQGYRIEYAAAADADTYAPEGFEEFFNQRRRWTPSSIANTLDLLSDFKKAVANNDSISRLYILYQMLVILFSMLGPAIIFSMMVFAQVAAFSVPAPTILWSNALPVLLFITLCFMASSKTQLNFAKLLSVAYAFIMMAVLIGTGIQIVTEGLGSPVAVFVVALASVFCAAAFFHPREFINIFYGFVFFLCIPCTYVIMSLYALINLNVINWGTREAAQKALGESPDEVKTNGFLRRMPFLGRRLTAQSSGGENVGIACGCERLCQCLVCPNDNRVSTQRDEKLICVGEHLERIENRLSKLDDRLENIGHSNPRLSLLTYPRVDARNDSVFPASMATPPSRPGTTSVGAQTGSAAVAWATPPEITITQETPLSRAGSATPRQDLASPTSPAELNRPRMPVVPEMPSFEVSRYRGSGVVMRNDTAVGSKSNEGIFGSLDSLLDAGVVLRNKDVPPDDSTSNCENAWLTTDAFSNVTLDTLDATEETFWKDLIGEYLTPIHKSKEEEAESAAGLKQLRNKIAFGVLLVNALLVLIIYLLQMNKEYLSIKFDPTGNYTQKRLGPEGKLIPVREPLKIEPIGFTIILFLSLILIVQTVGMLLHRFHTMSHVLASTQLPCFERGRSSHHDGEQLLKENAVEIAKKLQKLSSEDDSVQAGGAAGSSNIGGLQTTAAGGRTRRRLVFDLERGQKEDKKRSRGLQQAFQKRFFTFSADNHARSLKGIPLTKNIVGFTAPDSAKRAAAEAIRKRRDSMLLRSAERFAAMAPAAPRQTQPDLHHRSQSFTAPATVPDVESPKRAASSFLDEMQAAFVEKPIAL